MKKQAPKRITQPLRPKSRMPGPKILMPKTSNDKPATKMLMPKKTTDKPSVKINMLKKKPR